MPDGTSTRVGARNDKGPDRRLSLCGGLLYEDLVGYAQRRRYRKSKAIATARESLLGAELNQ
jgi:hypothetical protein